MMRKIRQSSFVALATVILLSAQVVAQSPINQIEIEDGKISANLREIPVTEVLKILAERSDYDFVISGGIQGNVTLYVTNLDPLELLDVVAELANIAYEKRGNIVKVYSAERYRQLYNKDFVDKRVTETIPLKHISINTVSSSISAMKSQNGSVIGDATANALIVTDIPAKIRDIKRVIAALDVAMETDVFTLKFISTTKLLPIITPYLSQAGNVQTNESTNQVIISESKIALDQVRAIVEAFDVPSYIETEVFHLRYPKNSSLLGLVEKEISEGLGKTIYDDSSNTLIVSAIPEDMTKVRSILGDIDRNVRSVLIEAKILQISLNDDFRMGVNWQFINNRLDSLNVRGIFNVLGSGEGGVTVMSGNLNDDNYTALVEALQVTGKSNLLSSPRVMTIEGEEAKIHVGSTVPYKTIDTREEDGAIRTFEQVTTVEVGVKLVVTPQVNEGGMVVMDITQEVSSVVGFRDGIPEISTSESATVVSIPDGITVVMAGLIKDETIKVENKVPLLGSIPLLGYLFKSTDSQTLKNELIVFLTPHVTSGEASPADMEKLNRIETGEK